MYVAAILFVIAVLGPVCAWCGIGIFRLIGYIKTELFIVLGTASSESVFPQLTEKLEWLGYSGTVVGLGLPAGYSFNLGGVQVHLALAALLSAQALGVHPSCGLIARLSRSMQITSNCSSRVRR